MEVNKVVVNTANGEETLIDLTGDSVTPETLGEGETAHNSAGEVIFGIGKKTAVLYTEQNLTEEQKSQARKNIGVNRNSITKTEINADGELIVTYADGATDNMGVVVGASAEMYSHKLYKVYSLSDIEKLCASRAITEFKIINCGEAFSHTSSGGDYTEINTGDIYRVGANNGTLWSLLYLDNSTVETEEGTLIEWYEADGEGGYTARYTPVLNGEKGITPVFSIGTVTTLSAGEQATASISGTTENPVLNLGIPKGADGGNSEGGNVGTTSEDFELIRKITVTEDDVSANTKGFDITVDSNNNEFSLKAITCFCYFPSASGSGTFEMVLKNSGGATKSAYKRTEVLATSQRWFRLRAKLEGYWTGTSVILTDSATSINAEYGSSARNNLNNKAYFIRLSSNIVLPEGTTIEVYGVRS